MSRMLTLIDAGWEAIVSLATSGNRRLALARVESLLARRDLPVARAAAARRLAGELCLDADHFEAARRHLRVAAVLEPTARTFYLRGLAYERDPHGCDRKAARAFRRAVRLEPQNPLYRAAYGRATVRCGRLKAGVRDLLAAAEAAPADAAVTRLVVEGLLCGGRLAAARRVLQRCRFLRPADRDLAGLWDRLRFEAARRHQAEQGRTTRHRQDAGFATDGGRVVLPLVRVVADRPPRPPSPDRSEVRRQVLSFPRPYFWGRGVRRADR